MSIKLSKEQVVILQRALEDIKADITSGKLNESTTGLCKALRDRIRFSETSIDVYDFVASTSRSWPQTTRVLYFPVCHDEDYYHFQGPNKVKRLNLLKFLAESTVEGLVVLNCTELSILAGD